MVLQNDVLDILVLGATHSVPVTDSGSTLPPPCGTILSPTIWRAKTLHDEPKILINSSRTPSSLQQSTGSASWPRQASFSYFAILAMASLLQLDLSNLQLEVFSSQLRLRQLRHSGALRHCISVLEVSLQTLVRCQAVSQSAVIGVPQCFAQLAQRS